MSEGGEIVKDLRDLCVRWLAEVFYDANRAVVCVRTRRPVPENEILGMLRSAYASVSNEAANCLMLPKSVMERDLLVSPTYIRKMPRTHLFYTWRSETFTHHPYVYEGYVWTPKSQFECVHGKWIFHRQDNTIVRVARDNLESVLSDDFTLSAKKRAEIPGEVAGVISQSEAAGLLTPDDGILVPIHFKEGLLRACPYETWTTIRLDPLFDNSPSLAPMCMLQPEFPTKLESAGNKIKYMSACKHTEMRAVRERRFTFTVDMGGDGSKSDRIRKRFFLTDIGCLRRVFEEKSLFQFVSQGEYTGRYIYEYIITERACRMYFDLDYDIPAKVLRFSGDEITRAAIRAIAECAKSVFGFEIVATDVLVAECDRADKISRHLIVRPMVFETVVDARLFATIIRHHVLEHSANFPELIKDDGECMIDPAVYNTGCQSFRPIGCSKAPEKKFGKSMYLRVAEMNECPLPHGASDFDLLVFSLVQNVSFGEVPPSERLYFRNVGDAQVVAVRRGVENVVEIVEPQPAKRKRPEASEKIPVRRMARVIRENEVALGSADCRSIFDQLVAFLPPIWGVLPSDFERFDVKMLRNEMGDFSFAVLGKKGKKSYCAILADVKMQNGITDVAQHCHRKSGVQFYIKEGRTGYYVSQRCKWRCASRDSVLVCSGRQSKVLDDIIFANEGNKLDK